MSATNRGAARAPHDYYATPAWTVRRLLEEVELPGGRWLEPCAGDGAIIRAVNLIREDVYWNAWELRQECAPDLERSTSGLPLAGRYGNGYHIGDFLKSADGIRACYSAVVTNPPYSLAEEFVRACLPLARHVAMLLRLNWLASSKRSSWLREHAPDVYVLPDRPSFTGGGSDACEYAWMVWGPERHRTRARGTITVLATTPADERRQP
jgi:hypothetical protein